MAKVKIQGHASGTGVLTVTAPNTSTDRTITLPDATGTLLNSDGSAASLTALNGTQVTSGTVPAARLPAGSILQTVHTTITDSTTTTSTTYSEFTQSASMTLTSSSNKILILINIHAYVANHTADSWSSANLQVYRDSLASGTIVPYSDGISPYTNTYAFGRYTADDNDRMQAYISKHLIDAPGDTSAHTYTVGGQSKNEHTIMYNAQGPGSITLMEIAV